jgi:OFA family oxalate/formate antiporter-like MFS transporter
VKQTGHSYTTPEMLRQPVFWVLYTLRLMMVAGALMVIANLAPLARAFGVAELALWGTTTLSAGLILANLSDGVGRPFFGWLGDRIGNTSAMAISFAVGAAGYYLMSVTGHHPLGYAVFAGVIFLCWGAIFSVFPAMNTDLFGPEYATANYSILYTVKGVAAFLLPLGTLLVTATGTWNSVLFLAAGISVLSTILVLAVLRPAEHRHHADEQGHAERVRRPFMRATTA